MKGKKFLQYKIIKDLAFLLYLYLFILASVYVFNRFVLSSYKIHFQLSIVIIFNYVSIVFKEIASLFDKNYSKIKFVNILNELFIIN